jgi:hypothetical protein
MSSRVCTVSSEKTPDGKRCLACRGCGSWVEDEVTMEEACFDYYRVCRRITRYAEPNLEPPGRRITSREGSRWMWGDILGCYKRLGAAAGQGEIALLATAAGVRVIL